MRDIGRHLNYLQSTPEVRNNTLKVEINDMGQIALRPIVGDTTQTFTNFLDARSYVRNILGLTGAHIQDTLGQQASGARFMRQFGTDVQTAFPGSRIIAPMEFNLEDMSSVNELKKIYMPDGKTPMGWLNIDDNKATLVQVRSETGELWDARRIFSFLEDTQGFTIPEFEVGPKGIMLPAKGGKRAKAFLHEKTYEMFMDTPLRVGVMDAAYNMDLDDLAKESRRLGQEQGLSGSRLEAFVRAEVRKGADFAADGISEASTGVFRKMLDAHKGYDADIGKEIDKAIRIGADDTTLRRLHNERRLVQKSVGELEGIIERGRGLFNTRLAGGEIVQLDMQSSNRMIQDIMSGRRGDFLDDIARITKDGIYIKGNFSLNPALDELGIDVRTHHQNILDEITLRPNRVNTGFLERMGLSTKGRSGYITFTPHDAMDTRLDIQTASSYPEFYTRKLLEEGTEKLIEQFHQTMKALQTPGGEIPASFRQILESQLDSGDPSVVRLAENVESFIKTGRAVSEDPYLMTRVLDTVAESLLVKKGDFEFPKIIIPDAIRAEVVPYNVVQGQVEKMDPGSIRYDVKGGQWVIHESDAIKVKPAFGGYDFDDALSGMIRYEKGSGGEVGRIKAIMIRQPNARGEWALFNMALDDDAVLGVVGKAGKANHYSNVLKNRNNMIKELEQLKSNISRVHGYDLVQEQNIMDRIALLEKAVEKLNLKVDEILRTSLRSTEEITTPSGKLPFRRGFSADGVFLGEGEVASTGGARQYRTFFTDAQGVKRIGYLGEPENFAYLAERAKDKPQFIRQTFRGMSDQQQIDMFGGMMARLQHNVGGDANIVGIWSNSRMFYDHFLAWNEDVALRSHLSKHFPTLLIEQEAVIDAFAQGIKGNITAEDVRKLSNVLVEGVIETAALGVSEGLDTRIDPTLLREKAKNSRAIRRGLERANEKIVARGGKAVVIKAPEDIASYATDKVSLLMARGDPKATIDVLSEGAERIHELRKMFREDIGYGDDILAMDDIRMSKQASRDAKNLIKAMRNSEARLSVRAVMEDVAPLLEDSRRTELMEGLLGMERGEYVRGVQDDFLVALSELFDEKRVVQDPLRGVEIQTRVAGDRAYQALIRMMQIVEDSPHKSYSMIGGALARIGMTEQVFDWKDIQLGTKPIDTLIDHRGVSDIAAEIGSTIRGREMHELVDEILKSTDISSDMLETVTRGFDLVARDDPLYAPEHVRRSLEGLEGARVVPEGATLRGPMDPGLVIKPGKKGYLPRTLGQVLSQYERATDEATKQRLASDVRQALLGFQSVMEDWAADSDMPNRLRDYVIRSMEQRPGQLGAEDVLRGQKARGAAAAAKKVAERSDMARGFRNMLSELSQTRGGRGIMAGVAGLASIGIIDSVRKKDRTINEMQGPAFMPGGNPYADDPNSVGVNFDYNQGINIPPTYTPSNTGQGMMYQVRTRGGEYDENFLTQMQGITGGNVTGTIYDDSAPFQSANVRDEILRMYG